MKKSTFFIITAVIFVVIIIWLFKPQKILAKKVTTKSDNLKSKPRTLILDHTDFPLKKGSEGIEVLYLQAWLNKYYENELELDGIFGGRTWAAAKNASWVPFIINYDNDINEYLYLANVKPLEAELKQYINKQGIIF